MLTVFLCKGLLRGFDEHKLHLELALEFGHVLSTVVNLIIVAKLLWSFGLFEFIKNLLYDAHSHENHIIGKVLINKLFLALGDFLCLVSCAISVILSFACPFLMLMLPMAIVTSFFLIIFTTLVSASLAGYITLSMLVIVLGSSILIGLVKRVTWLATSISIIKHCEAIIYFSWCRNEFITQRHI